MGAGEAASTCEQRDIRSVRVDIIRSARDDILFLVSRLRSRNEDADDEGDGGGEAVEAAVRTRAGKEAASDEKQEQQREAGTGSLIRAKKFMASTPNRQTPNVV